MGHFSRVKLVCSQCGHSQLVPLRFHGMEEVDGSNPSRSTNIPRQIAVSGSTPTTGAAPETELITHIVP